MTSRRIMLVVAVIAAGIVAAVLALRGKESKPPSKTAATDGAALTSAVDGGRRDVPGRRTERPRSVPGAVSTETIVDDALVTSQEPTLTTRGRRAWKLEALVGDAYWDPQKEVHVHTADGQDFIVRGAGKEGDDVILVERDDGTRYVGWLVPGADQFGEALGDAERPAERLENVIRVTVQEQPKPVELPPARLEVIIDGQLARTLAPEDVAAIASAKIPTKDGGTTPAIDLTRDLGGTLELISVTSEGVASAAASPVAGSRPVVYANRRKRFKLAWIDAAGAAVEGSKARELSRVELRRR